MPRLLSESEHIQKNNKTSQPHDLLLSIAGGIDDKAKIDRATKNLKSWS